MPYDIRDMSHIGEISVNHPRHLVKSVDLSATGWKEVASHEVFTVTGGVRMWLWTVCTESLAGAGTIKVGTETGGYGADNAFFPEGGLTDTDAGQFLVGAYYQGANYVSVQNGDLATALRECLIYDLDIGYTIGSAAATGGTLEFHCIWEPLTAGASVVLGAGGSL